MKGLNKYQKGGEVSGSSLDPMSIEIEIKREDPSDKEDDSEDMRGGGSVMRYAKGGMTGGRDGCAIRGKTKGRMV
jgi:hypothetical protein